MQGIEVDERDAAIVAERMRALDERDGPRVGDHVLFADGTERRISYHWKDDAGWDGGVQTSGGGSWHLGEYGCSFSGGLFGTVPVASLTLTDERRPGAVWIFHHGIPRAHSGVTFRPDFRVFTCDRPAPR